MNKEKFIEILQEILEKEENTVRMEDPFRQYEEWDSLAVLAIVAIIDEHYNITIPRTEFEILITVNDLFNYVQNKI